MYLLGFDVGSSSVKASLLDVESGRSVASAFYPRTEMAITAEKPGWAEQSPDLWWKNLVLACRDVLQQVDTRKVAAIGISYQMHGLVMIDKQKKVLRPSIIWCDSRAVPYGEKAFQEIGEEKCLSCLLNSPGNFTASKLKWVKENEPDLYEKIWKIMLPGDYIAMRLTGEVNTTISGLSEGIFWDFTRNEPAGFLLGHYGFDPDFIPEIVDTFSVQGKLLSGVADELDLPEGIPVAYRAGDQPNNAFSLNVLNPGEIAATAGTSGVVYGISDEVMYDPESRVNTFAHVNHAEGKNRLGVLLCVNGTGILYSWLKRNFGSSLSYEEMNDMAAAVSPGSGGVSVLPFGNGAERMLGNQEPGCQISGLNFNIHQQGHLVRAAQEGVAYAFRYGIDIMNKTGIHPEVIRAGNANMFLSPVFRNTLAAITGAGIELYDTDGSQGAALGSGIGSGIYRNSSQAFSGLRKIREIEPDKDLAEANKEAYSKWTENLHKILNK